MYINRRQYFSIKFLIVLLGIVIFGFKESQPGVSKKTGGTNLAYRWAEVALTATANDTEQFRPRPTITSRYLALIHIAMFDAWSRYDTSASPAYLTGVERLSSSKSNDVDTEKAISYAAYRTLNEYYYSDSSLFREFMTELNLDPDNKSLDPSTPEGIGNLAAEAVIDARRNDGSNQYGDMDGSEGKVYH